MGTAISGITGLGDVRELGRIGRRTIVYYLVTTGLSVSIGILLVLIIQSGRGISIGAERLPENILEKAANAGVGQAMKDMVTGLIPANIIKAAAETEVLPLILFSLFFGGVLTTLGKQAEATIDLLNTLNEVVMRMVMVIMKFAPLGSGRWSPAGWARPAASSGSGPNCRPSRRTPSPSSSACCSTGSWRCR